MDTITKAQKEKAYYIVGYELVLMLGKIERAEKELAAANLAYAALYKKFSVLGDELQALS